MLSQVDTKIFLNTYLVIQIFIPFCGIVLHLLFLYAVWKDPLKCLRKLGTAFVMNLAVSDFLFCFTLLIRVSIHLVVDICLFATIYCLLLLTNFAINPLIYIFCFPNYRKTFRILYGRK